MHGVTMKMTKNMFVVLNFYRFLCSLFTRRIEPIIVFLSPLRKMFYNIPL